MIWLSCKHACEKEEKCRAKADSPQKICSSSVVIFILFFWFSFFFFLICFYTILMKRQHWDNWTHILTCMQPLKAKVFYKHFQSNMKSLVTHIAILTQARYKTRVHLIWKDQKARMQKEQCTLPVCICKCKYSKDKNHQPKNPKQDTDLLWLWFCFSWQRSSPAHVLRIFWWMHFNSIVLILVLSPFWLHRYYEGFTFRLIGSTFRHIWFWLKIVVRLNIIVIACLWIRKYNES